MLNTPLIGGYQPLGPLPENLTPPRGSSAIVRHGTGDAATTETIDRLFLELSQFTTATTHKELLLQEEVERLRHMIQRVIWSAEQNGWRVTSDLFDELCSEFK